MDTQNNSGYLKKMQKASEFKCKLQPSHPYNHVLRHLQVLDHYGWILLNIILRQQCMANTYSNKPHSMSLVTSSLRAKLSSPAFRKTGGSKV